jgi:hypothetical protein
MSTAFSDLGTHPILVAVTGLHDQLDELSQLPAWSLSDAELATTLPLLASLRSRLNELELRLAHHGDTHGLGTEVGAADTAAWWANTTRQTKPGTRRRLALAASLDRHECVRAAMAAGTVAEEQAAVIVKGIDALPADLVDPETRDRAQTELVRLAAHHDARDLARLAARILEVVAPQVAEAHERTTLEREEQHALQACRFTMSEDGHGQCHGRFTVPSHVAAILKKAVFAIAAPKHRAAAGLRATTGPGATTGPLRLGQAFCEYVETYPTDRLPNAGGVDATVVVTMSLEQLLGTSNAPATLDTGHRITAGQARRLACGAAIIPAVLGGTSEILDLGRSRRFHTKAQRLAIAHRDHTCTAQGCDWPAAMCHVHHDTPWSRGGTTTITHGRLLCPRHHAYAHSPTYTMTKSKHGRVSFLRT